MYEADSLGDEQLAGLRLMVGFRGQALDDDLRLMITKMHVGGLILFKRNVSDPSQVAELCQAAQACAVEGGNPRLMIAIDQEGGPVARLGPPFTVFPGNRAIGAARSDTAAREFGTITARELKGVGITMNLAPVLDVAPVGLDSVMADRAFGSEPELVARLGKTVIETLQGNGIPATAKHFPGIGRTTLDSHVDLPSLDTAREVLDSTDLVPFRAAIESGVEAVMLSHVIYRDLDGQWPASLSTVIASDLLRNTMGFKGVTMTDDLDMGAINKHFDVETTVRRILDADIDIALICHDQLKVAKAYEVLLKAVRASRDARQKAMASARRILNMKQKYLP
ncbi:MAG: beta-N-acetylhexosaminidase [Deltaproteobacteria bacterium]|nr:beta-N-acetylhexosaminidase [Deltaproteobacteria bacterium]MBW2021058.1 beta-N-acetylhexosaminidase [Deltaproteobacteria bacterium]MBW2075710.1 beta-N-acetylhexosaminidase [Deltaproteobacteria bacterium]RLB80942.1 MAG: beta-N-acetylhexosaminidase [Deltaproteobacteria bacterium]